MNCVRFGAVVTWLVLAFSLTLPVHASASDEPIGDRRLTMPRVVDATVAQYASQVLAAADVPGGVVWLERVASAPRYVFPEIDGTIAEILDTAVRFDPSYRWDEDAGVINVAPRYVSSPVLDCVVRRLEIGRATRSDVIGQILALPEVEACAARNHLQPGFRFLYPRSCTWNPAAPHTFADVTVRQVLNAIVRQEGKCQWRYREWIVDDNVAFAIE